MPGLVEDRLQELARHDGDSIALRCKEKALSFADLREALDALAARIGSVESLHAVAVLPDGVATYLLHLHFFKGRGTLVPQSPATTPDYLSAIVSRIRPGLVITSPALIRKYAGLDFGCPVLLVHEDPSRSGEITWECSDLALDTRTRVESEVRVVLFTSGSTGTPKGVCLGERCLEAAARMNVEILSLGPRRRSLATVPLYDYYGLIQIYSHLLAGGELVLGETVAFTGDLLRQAGRVGVTDLVGVPFGLRRIFGASAETDAHALAGLEVVTSSSEALSADVLQLIFRQCPDVTVFDIYGLNEAGRACSRAIRRGQEESRSIGRPSAGVTITAGVSPHEPDEIVIHGPNVMLGYLSHVTVDGRLLYEPCQRVSTGDLGYLDSEGNVHLTGRRDHLLNVHGRKLHPTEIESIALESAEVSDARARLASAAEPQLILEVVTSDPDASLTSLRRHLRKRLPVYFVPSRIVQVERIERTELGSKTVRS